MIQSIIKRLGDSRTHENIRFELKNHLTENFDGMVDPKTVFDIVEKLYPSIPLICDIINNDYELSTQIPMAEECGLDLSKGSIQKRNPPQGKAWKDPQRQLYDETICAGIVLKSLYMGNDCRYPVTDDFRYEFPELDKSFSESEEYKNCDEKGRKNFDKLSQSKVDYEIERLICNTMHIVAKLYSKSKKVFKTQCVYLVANIAGDRRGHMGRDPSSNTLRLITRAPGISL